MEIWWEDVYACSCGCAFVIGLWYLVKKNSVDKTIGLWLVTVSPIAWMAGGVISCFDFAYQSHLSRNLKESFHNIVTDLNKISRDTTPGGNTEGQKR